MACGIALALVVALIFGISHTVSNWGYRGVVNNLFKSIENRDADRMYSRVMAKYWIDYVEADGDGDEGIEWAEDYIEDFYDDVDCGNKVKITYEIRDKRRATKNELEGLEKNIYNWTAYYVRDRDEFSISDAYALDIVFTVHGNERTEEFSFNDELLVIKENGKWRKAGGWIKCSFYTNQ